MWNKILRVADEELIKCLCKNVYNFNEATEDCATAVISQNSQLKTNTYANDFPTKTVK